MIQVFDDIIPQNLQDYLEEYLIYNKNPEIKWLLQYNLSGMEGDSSFGFASSLFYGIQPEEIKREHTFNFLQVCYTLVNHLNLKLMDVYSFRAFTTCPSTKFYGPVKNGIHVDLKMPHQVMIYYVNDSDGDTILYEKDKKTIIKKIAPKKGRIVFFNGDIPHCASIPQHNLWTVLNINVMTNSYPHLNNLSKEGKKYYIYNKE